MSAIVITWKEARAHTIGAAKGGKTAKGEEVAGHGRVRLIPGANAIDANDWAAVRKLGLIKHYIDKGLIVEGTTVAGDLGSLEGVKPDEAIKLVGETLDRKRLTTWLEMESRPAVKSAIESRLAAVDSARRGSEEKPPAK